jgi:hypothetical protein
MKTQMMKLFSICILVLVTSTAWSLPVPDVLVTDVDPPDTGWWMKSDTFDTNPDANLHDSGIATENAWVAGILDYAVDRVTSIPDGKINNPVGGDNFASGFDPGFSWDFAIVKYGNVWSLYQDDASNDNLVTVGPFGNGISHMSFFGDTSVLVPEPLTLILLGIGLLGVAGLRRKN